jgi:hypothetical protein
MAAQCLSLSDIRCLFRGQSYKTFLRLWFTNFRNKLECLSLAKPSLMFEGKALEPTQVVQLRCSTLG